MKYWLFARLSVLRPFPCSFSPSGHPFTYKKQSCCDRLSEFIPFERIRNFYARSDEGRRTVKKSLKIWVLTEALARLAAFLEERGREEMPVESVSWHLAVDMYVQKQEMRPNLKPAAMESIKFSSGRAKKLVDHDRSIEAITESMCRIWWKKDALAVLGRYTDWPSGQWPMRRVCPHVPAGSSV